MSEQNLPAENKPTVDPNAPPQTWDEIFKHPRFKQLADDAKQAKLALEAAEQAQREAAEAKLKEQNEFKQLYEQAKAQADELSSKLTATEQAARRTANLRALQDAAQRQQPAWDAKAIKDLARFVEPDVLDAGDLDEKAAEAQIKAIASERPYVITPQRQDGGSPALRKQAQMPKPQPSGRPLTL